MTDDLDTDLCPFCHSTIDARATVCPACNAYETKKGWVPAHLAAEKRSSRLRGMVALLIAVVAVLWAFSTIESAQEKSEEDAEEYVDCVVYEKC